MAEHQSPTPPPPSPLSEAARLAVEAATRGHADFDAFFQPKPTPRPAERVIGVRT